ncbi:alpha/beta hydrolase family protein [Antricoccus suffuscus]|uniref:Alpha/beta hydrolase family protein n=1 Tax=Antricoccus suffuscus TaxID=1629062 RepID=A0A2T0ZXX5_9ACTN|nr:alpha/beta fold hydrolase [Antricoccus suffuscus]PRZ41206.1 alpha/beta hydrolase family protein [Antricoccus suffuscus]
MSSTSTRAARSTTKPTAVKRRGALFDSAFHDGFGQWPVGYIPVGGADMGDIVAVANVVADGDDSAFYDAWVDAAATKYSEAEAVLAAGHPQSARDLFLRSSCLYAAAYHPLYGTPVDPRLLSAFNKQMNAFRRGMELSTVPVHPVAIPYENTELPAYLVPAFGRETEVRPLLILNNGYDATITDLYFASGIAALRRGYHVLMFDGPGQGAMLYERGVSLRPDWEVVIAAVVDYAETVKIVDRAKIALSGWSLGGYLAPRAASAEPRLAACIADPGQWDIAESIRGFAMRFGASAEDVADLDNLPDATIEGMWSAIQADRQLRWAIVQRGLWANGAKNLREFISKSARYTLKDRVGRIRCPMLLTAAEHDPLAVATSDFYDALTSEKTLLRFTAAEGAGEHCEMGNRSLLNQRVLDWLDDTLSPDAPSSS